MATVVKWKDLESDILPEDLGIKDDVEIISVNLAKNRILVKDGAGDYSFRKLTPEAAKLVRTMVKNKGGEA